MFIIKTRKKHKGGGRLHGQRASLANEWFELRAAPPSPGAPPWEDRSLRLFRGTNKGWEKPGLHSGGARTLLLTSETGQVETPQDAPVSCHLSSLNWDSALALLPSWHSSTLERGVPWAKGRTQLWGRQTSRALTKWHMRSNLGLWLQQPTARPPPNPPRVPLTQQGCQLQWAGESMPFIREWSHLRHDPQDFCSDNRDPARPLIEQWWLLKGEGPALALTQFQVSPPTEVMITDRTPWRKMWLLFLSDPAYPPKPLGRHGLYKDAATHTPSRLQEVTASLNFISEEKVKQNEKRNLFQSKNKRKSLKKKKRLMK